MRKTFLILAIAIATTTVTFGQKKSTLSQPSLITYNVGAEAQFPIGNSVDVKTPLFGESVRVSYQPTKQLAYTLSASYLQNKNQFVQVPVLAGLRYNLVRNVFVGVEAGASFFNNSAAQFTYSPTVSVRIKRFTITERFLGSIKNGQSTSTSVGLGVSFRL